MGSTIDTRSRSIAATAKNKYAYVEACRASPLLHSIKILWPAAAAAANEWSRQTTNSKLRPQPKQPKWWTNGTATTPIAGQNGNKLGGDINGMSDAGY